MCGSNLTREQLEAKLAFMREMKALVESHADSFTNKGEVTEFTEAATDQIEDLEFSIDLLS